MLNLDTFAFRLIAEAEGRSWEDHEIARLVVLISEVRNWSSEQILLFLVGSQVCKPIVLSCLFDFGVSFSGPCIVHAMHEQADHIERFIDAINDCLEEGVLSTEDDESIQQMYEVGTQCMETSQYLHYAGVICSHTEKKNVCGRVLHVLCGHMQSAEAASFICDIIRLDFFADLRGTMEGFLAAIAGNLLFSMCSTWLLYISDFFSFTQ
jgi:hypothetical protein